MTVDTPYAGSGCLYRLKVLDQVLGMHAINAVARIVQDVLQSTYNACFEEAGQTSCSHKP